MNLRCETDFTFPLKPSSPVLSQERTAGRISVPNPLPSRKKYLAFINLNGPAHCLSKANLLLFRFLRPVLTGVAYKFDLCWLFIDYWFTFTKSLLSCFDSWLTFDAIALWPFRRRRSAARERRAETVDVGTLTNPERIPLTERAKGHERSESKASFATSSGRGSTLSTIGDHDGGEQWPEPPDDVVSEFIRQHLKHFNKGSFCSTFSDETLNGEDRASSRIPNFDISGTL